MYSQSLRVDSKLLGGMSNRVSSTASFDSTTNTRIAARMYPPGWERRWVEQIDFAVMAITAPLWGIVIPGYGLFTEVSSIRQGLRFEDGNLYAGIVALVASCFCYCRFLYLMNSKFTFAAAGVRLPGLDYRFLPYDRIKRVCRYDSQRPLFLSLEYVPFDGIFRKIISPSPTVERCFQITSQEAADELYSKFENHCQPEVVEPRRESKD